MRLLKPTIFIFILLQLNCNCWYKNHSQKKHPNQYPSPMVEYTRRHERIKNNILPGETILIDSLLPKPIEIFIPEKFFKSKEINLLIHFHGASCVSKYAVYQTNQPFILANINLGSGSSKYEKPFLDKKIFPELIFKIKNHLDKKFNNFKNFKTIYLSSFSAGYGAVRAIIQNEDNNKQIAGIIILDGLHTDYIPDRLVLAKGGRLNTKKLKMFIDFAALAKNGKKKFLITHSEIFPATYASTTETADYIIKALSLKKRPILKRGPLGMQQTSETIHKNLWILGFAGNTAPDHIDFYHGLHYFLNFLLDN
ncbi:hypothetical protein H8E88_30400 [candidate division KSB1 bacterium]|nr:hypothetical protein [candidate division KSB1 bacterium]MBL7093735.1 hypothetical protein [candidate division KSB1 bacterium]